MKTIARNIVLALVVALMAAGISFAQSSNRPPILPTDLSPDERALIIPNSANSSSPEEQYFGGYVLPAITRTVIALSGALAFVFMIVGGIQILTAYGNEERVAAGRKTMAFAVIGLVIAMLAFAIVQIISSVQIAPNLAPGSEDMTEEEMNDPGQFGPGSEPIQGGVQSN